MTPRSKRRQRNACRVRSHSLTSLCLISHHPFFSTIREALFVLRKLIDACNERSCSRRVGASRASPRFANNLFNLRHLHSDTHDSLLSTRNRLFRVLIAAVKFMLSIVLVI